MPSPPCPMPAIASPRATNPPGLPLPSNPQDAARRVYMISELRQEIFGFVEKKKDLARCVRLSSDGVAEAVKSLYRSVSYGEAQAVIGMASPRQQIYLDAITEINARPLHPSSEILDRLQVRMLGLDRIRNSHNAARRIPGYLAQYHPDIVTFVALPLRERCRNLRRVLLGADYVIFEDDWWVVHFDPDVRQGGVSSGSDKPIRGRIEVVTSGPLDTDEEPPTTIPYGDYTSPSDAFSFTLRFNLALRDIGSDLIDPALFQRWLVALREGPLFDKVYKAISIGDYPLPLTSLTDICRRQDACGAVDRIDSISASYVPPFDLGEFQTFAALASHSLTFLHVAISARPPEEDIHLSFADLPALIFTIRGDLVNLDSLTLDLKGIATAESFCKSQLTENILDDGGTLSNLTIVTTPHDTPLFNTIRLLSRICKRDATISVNEKGSVRWPPKVQRHFLRYLRDQSPARKIFLGTADFAYLGIADPHLVHCLRFDADGRPRRLIEGQAEGWADDIAKDVQVANHVAIPLLQQRLGLLADASAELSACAAGADDTELLAGAEHLLVAAEATRRAVQQVDAVSAAQVEQIRSCVTMLRETVNMS